MTKMVKIQVSLKLDCGKVLSAIHGLLGTLSSLDTIWKDKIFTNSVGGKGPEQVVSYLFNSIIKLMV